jgi:hypothetical protein
MRLQAERLHGNQLTMVQKLFILLKLTKGNGFKTPAVLASRKSENQASVSVEIMNGAALALNSNPFAQLNLKCK